MNEFYLKDDFIKLGQVLKASGLCETGVDAKYSVTDGKVKVNGEIELQRGKKIVPGDLIEYNGKQLIIKKKEDRA